MALNIEHAYWERTGEYEAFEGLCFADTLDMTEDEYVSLFTVENTARIRRQKTTPINVLIGNPPYNVGQLNENDNNKNRKYAVIDKRVKDTYARDSSATLKSQLYDPYVKFIRWATDRLGQRDGVVCFVTNNSFVDQIAFDGMRKHLLRDFTRVFHLHLEGNVRQNPKLAGTTYNVFGIQVGVGVTIAIRSSAQTDRSLLFHRVDKNLRKERKLAWLVDHNGIQKVAWETLIPDTRFTWLSTSSGGDFARFLGIGSKAAKAEMGADSQVIFGTYSPGVNTGRDTVVYGFDPTELSSRTATFCDVYNSEVDRFKRKGERAKVDEFVDYAKLKWSENLKNSLKRHAEATHDKAKIRVCLYRPFNRQHLYHDSILNDRPGLFSAIFPSANSSGENRTIAITNLGSEKPFMTLVTGEILDYHLVGAGCGTLCFPFYVYDEDGSNRRENITDWALEQFRTHYEANGRREPAGEGAAGDEANGRREPAGEGAAGDEVGAGGRRTSRLTPAVRQERQITKWDIFYYVYGLLHHPGYRTKFADNLKRELPRIPLAPELAGRASDGAGGEASPSLARPANKASGFWAFADAGRELAKLHLDYEKLEPWPLQWIETEGVPLSYRVDDKMRLAKDKTSLKVNPSLTLAGIPPAVFQYRLGNRSALDWVIDQYQVSEDKRSGIKSDPNRADDPEYIVRLVGQVVRVSVETVRIVNALPEKFA